MDVDWSCEWAWQSRGGTQQKVVAAREQGVNSAAAALIAAAQRTLVAAATAHLVSSNPDISLSASTNTLGQLESLADGAQGIVRNISNQLGRVVNQFVQVGQLALKFAQLPFDVANTAVALAKNTIAQGNQLIDEFGLLPCEATITSNNVADLTRSASYFGQVGDLMTLTNRQALVTGGQIRDFSARNPGRGSQSVSQTSAALDGQVLAVRKVRAGDTPTSLSVFYYGNPDHDVNILRANGLPWYQVTLDPGAVLLIPQVSTAQGP